MIFIGKKERLTNINQVKKRVGKTVETISVFYKKQCTYNPQMVKYFGKKRTNKVKNGYNVRVSDIVDRGYPNTETIDFLTYNEPITTDVITNPPYKLATQFVRHSLDLAQDGIKVAMFLKIQFLEGKERKKLFTEYPPKTIYVSSSRLLCAKNGEFEKMKAGGGSAVAYAWYVWVKGYRGDTIVKWIN